MGQILSNLDEGEAVDSGVDPTGVGDIRKQAMDAKRIATLSWPEFVNCINGLNEKCKRMVDDQGKHLVFAVRKGSTETYIWKATVQICCMKFNTITKKPETFKLMNLPKFLRVYSSLIGLLNELPDVDGAETDESTERAASTSSSSTGATAWNAKYDLNASLLLEKVDAFDTLPVSSQESATECIVCMERQPDVVLPCSHAYCLPCIEQWNVNNHDCPTCRADIRSTDEAWVISDYPDKREFTDYLLQLTE